MLLTIKDDATIRNIIDTRLCSLPNVAILDFKIKELPDAVKIGVLLDIDHLKLSVCSIYELPKVFSRQRLLTEIDEVAEGIKVARLETSCTRLEPSPLSRKLPGTGLRGRWNIQRPHV